MAASPKVLEILEVVTQDLRLESVLPNQFRELDLRGFHSDRMVRVLDDDGRIAVHLFRDTFDRRAGIANLICEGSIYFDNMPTTVIAAAVLRLLEEV